MLRGLDRLVIRVPAIAPAVHFYRDVLGMRLIREEANVASLRFDDDAGGELILHTDTNLADTATFVLVDDVRAMYRERDRLRLSFAGPPARSARGYRATVRDPFGTVLNLIDRSGDNGGGGAAAHGDSRHLSRVLVEDARPAGGSLFAGVAHKVPPRRDTLVRLYTQVARTADDLPYTPHFEAIYEPYIAEFEDPRPDRAEVWRHLLNLRKRAGNLPKLGEARSPAPEVPAEALEHLRALLGEDIGRRDRLPYTTRFEEIVEGFNDRLSRKLSPHLVWRLIATMAK